MSSEEFQLAFTLLQRQPDLPIALPFASHLYGSRSEGKTRLFAPLTVFISSLSGSYQALTINA